MKTPKISLSIILVALSILYINSATYSAEQPQKQTICPVMGGEINKNYYADVEGKRIYVCCPGCIDAVKKDPSKYISQMEEEGIALENTPENEMNK